ncbi:MAG: PAS domain-containing protein [Lentimicrobium sp.]|nr:PAS domain-containing protein [Lentimicrobium sp.]
MKFLSSIREYLRSRSLVELLTLSIIGISVFSVLLLGIFSTVNEYHRFKTESENLRNSYTEDQKRLIEDVVDNAINYIEFNRSLSQERIKQGLKLRVDEAWEIANNIYLENRYSHSKAEIMKMIKDALRPIRFNNGRGDVFIYSTEGESIMLPRSRKFENRSSLQLQDSLGNFLVQNEVRLMKKVDQGFLSYEAPVPGSHGDSAVFKYSYIRRFGPYNWYLGSKDYLKDFEDDLKKELLDWLSFMRYSEEGYIFINTLSGKALLTNGMRLENPTNILAGSDTNWIEVFKKQQQIARTTEAGFIDYNFVKLASKDIEPKVSYIRYYKDWDWIIGAGFYKNDIERDIAGKQEALQAKIIGWVTRTSVFIAIFLVLIFILARFVSRILEKEFSRFTVNFRKASLESELMNKELISFVEFRELAGSVNNTIIERDFARSAFVKEQALLRSVIDSIPDFIFFKDVNSKYVGCNKSFAYYIGMPEKEIIGRTDFDFFSEKIAEVYHSADKKILTDRIPIRTEEWSVFPDGSRRLLDTVKVLFYDNMGSILGIMALSRDITEKEEIRLQFKAAKEKAEESDRLKTAFLANMSHEIRTPMNSIIGFSALLKEDDITENDRIEFIQYINQAGESLLNLIDDIIDVSKIEAGQLAVYYENYSLNELMDELFSTYSELIRRKSGSGVQLIVEPGKLPKGNLIFTDPFRLRQVISNLLVNAVKFTGNGQITFGFTPKGDKILFYVKDTGIGISEENQKIIFNRFRQAHSEAKRHQGGTGLGLAISQHIVDLLGGEIWVESMLGNGAAFYFTIPYKPVETHSSDDVSKTMERALNYDWSTKNLLLIEEIDSNYNYVSAALSRTGINLHRAKDEQSGLQICHANEHIDLAMLDLSKYEDGAQEIVREIKKSRPAMPVIAQIAHSKQKVSLPDKTQECDEYILKPVKFNTLMNILAIYLEPKK